MRAGWLAAVAAVIPAVAGAQPQEMWRLDLGSTSYGSATIDDIDCDGSLEILFGTYYNDERLLVLDSATGAIEDERPSGGGPIDDSVAVADLNRDGLPEILWGNSADTVFHVMTPGGAGDEWTFTAGEVLDAPAAVADLDGDGAWEVVLASCGSDTGVGLRVLSGEDGDVIWRAAQSGCYQSAPLIFDIDGDGVLDVVVSTWFDSQVRAFRGTDGALLWTYDVMDWMYHAGSFGDLDGDGAPEVALGDYTGRLFVIHGDSGLEYWTRDLGEVYVFGPTGMGDLDGDGSPEVVVTASHVHVFAADGTPRWSSPYIVYAARGPALADADGDGDPDVIVATKEPSVRAFDGAGGAPLWRFDLPAGCDADFAPVVWDFDGDGLLDVFVVCGRGLSDPDPENNWGVAIALRGEGVGTGWPTFSRDLHHSANLANRPGHGINEPAWDPGNRCGADAPDAGPPGQDAGGPGADGEGGCGCHAGGAGRLGGALWLALACLLLLAMNYNRRT